MPRPRRVTIIGLGLIGGSIGFALRDGWPKAEITGYDLDPAVMSAALAAGAITRACARASDCCDGADFVFIATPLPVIPEILESISTAIGPKTIVTDVGSTKTSIVAAARELLPPGATFIGGHPMAGSEQGGFESATRTLLKEAVYVLTPTSSTEPEAFQRLHELLTRLGARVMALAPDKHDEVVAAVSHLPHVLAASLVNLVGTVEEGVENRLLFAAGGFRDTTRIAGSNPDLWVEVCLDNREAILDSIDKFQVALEQARDFVAGSDREGLRDVFTSAKEKRLSLSIGEPTPAALRELDVIVSDRPGTISQITMTFGQLGINIEDIRIVHLSGEKGVIKMMVDDDPNLDRAMALLKEYGFDVLIRK